MPQPTLTEPVIVPCLFCTNIQVDMDEGFVRLICWVDLPRVEHDQPERRIMGRLALPDSTARRLRRDLQRALGQGGH